MNLKGVLDFSLDNFLCIRGFAPMGTLYDISERDPSIQRDLLREHRDEMVAFISQGEFLFFPEVILCTTLCHEAAKRWCSAVNNWGQLGRWVFHVCKDPQLLGQELAWFKKQAAGKAKPLHGN